MNFYVTKFKWLMLVSGILTCTMLLGLVAPTASLESNFGETMQGPLADVIVRNWSFLIGLMGIMLIYGAFVEKVRAFALVIAGLSKAIFIALILIYAPHFINQGAGTAVVSDTLMIVLYAAYLILSARRR